MASSARPARRYPTDLTNRQWRLVEPLLPAPPAGPAGRPRKHPPREIVNAILYHVRAGGAWRMLPRDFPPWQTVYWYFTLWRTDGTLDRLHDALREQTRAKRSGRQKKDPAPSAGVVDSVTARRGHRGFGLAGLRRREEGERTQEAHRHRHHRLAAGSRGDRGQRAGPRRRTSHPQAAARLFPACVTSGRTGPTPGGSSPSPRAPGGSRWRWCASRPGSGDSPYCPGDGSSNAPSPG